jgi:hypothetical protein
MVNSAQQRLRDWLQQHRRSGLVRQAEALPVRRDTVTLLEYMRANRVIGTRSTGNLPLKVIREVTARFVNPPPLETTIGERTYRLRTETDLWPLYFLHILAEVGGLLTLAPGRHWRLTGYGEAFLEMHPLLQTSFLLTVWWYEVNWLVAYPFQGMGEALPLFFRRTVLARLLSLPVQRRTPFEPFADELIDETGLTWTAPDSSYAPMLLRGSIDQMVIRVLKKFRAVECEYRREPVGRTAFEMLDAFAITPFGRALLEAVVIGGGE